MFLQTSTAMSSREAMMLLIAVITLWSGSSKERADSTPLLAPSTRVDLSGNTEVLQAYETGSQTDPHPRGRGETNLLALAAPKKKACFFSGLGGLLGGALRLRWQFRRGLGGAVCAVQ